MAVVNDIEGLLDWGRVNGVETHPNVFGLLGFKKMSKENKNFEEEKRSLF